VKEEGLRRMKEDEGRTKLTVSEAVDVNFIRVLEQVLAEEIGDLAGGAGRKEGGRREGGGRKEEGGEQTRF
jgi:hypothetical protein